MTDHDELCPVEDYWRTCVCDELKQATGRGYLVGYGAAMDDGWGEPGHIAAALDAAVQRVEALRFIDPWESGDVQFRCITAIKGGQ